MGLLDFLFPPYTVQKDRSYGSNSRQKLDLYIPKKGVTSSTNVIVFFYGGGFQQGNKADYNYVGDTFARQGYIVVVPNYRLWSRNNPTVNQWPTQIDDGAKAVGWVRSAYPGKRVFLMGHSGGGVIAKHLILDEHWLPTPAAGGIGVTGTSDFSLLNRPDLLPENYFPAGTGETRNATFHVSGSEPPMLLQHGLADDLEPPNQTELLEQAIVQAGGVVEAKYYAGVDHYQIVYALDRNGANPQVRNDILAWLAVL